MNGISNISSIARRKGRVTAVERGLPAGSGDSYLQRKFLEASLINRCLAAPLDLQMPASAKEVIDQKFQLAAALRAERSLQSWAMTETARPEVRRWASGPFQFSFGYQRADLAVRGPAIYQSLRGAARSSLFQKTIYTSSGMSAIAGLFTSLLRMHERLDVSTPRTCYGETRELMKSFGKRIGIIPRERWRGAGAGRSEGTLRVLLLDSCVNARYAGFQHLSPRDFDLMVFDTTCFWRGSSRIGLAMRWALRAGLPVALVRSHAKLDCLGVEYGRLGSIVLVASCADAESKKARWMGEVARQTRDSIRLFGAAPIPSHFPPFTGTPDYENCSVARTAAIMRNSRRLHGLLAAGSGHHRIVAFQHGLYLALSPAGNMRMRHVKHAAAGLCGALAARGLPVEHAGSFGFDFVAIEWFPDPISRRNVIRIAPGDLPITLINEIAVGIDDWWSAQRAPISLAGTRPESRPRRGPDPAAGSGRKLHGASDRKGEAFTVVHRNRVLDFAARGDARPRPAENVVPFFCAARQWEDRAVIEFPALLLSVPGATGAMSHPLSPAITATILVVDDDRDGADTTTALLETLGFTVVSAYSAREGLDRLDEHPEISLVISDIRMPDIDGFDFMRVVKHRFPAVRTLLTTGLPVTDDDVVPRGASILQKPFAAEALERAVAEQLQMQPDAGQDTA